jgi:hypothetical protein
VPDPEVEPDARRSGAPTALTPPPPVKYPAPALYLPASAVSFPPFRSRSSRCITIVVLGIAVALATGCGGDRVRQDGGARAAAGDRLNSAESLVDQSFDFGPVVQGEGSALTHEYTVTNTGSKPIKLLGSVNGKPCCGDVESLKPTILAPRQSVALKVSLRPEKLGPIQHFAAVETDMIGKSKVTFSTFAKIYPRAQILESDEGFVAPVSGVSGRKSFVAVAYGTKRLPPIALDDAELKATAETSWAGPARERAMSDHVLERTRSFSLSLGSEGEPGYRFEHISLVRKSSPLAGYTFQWELPRALKVMPGSVILPSNSVRTEKKVVLTSTDRREFRVLRVQTGGKRGIEVDWKDRPPAAMNSIRISVDPASLGSNVTAEVKIYTDHPVQPLATVQIFISPSSG